MDIPARWQLPMAVLTKRLIKTDKQLPDVIMHPGVDLLAVKWKKLELHLTCDGRVYAITRVHKRMFGTGPEIVSREGSRQLETSAFSPDYWITKAVEWAPRVPAIPDAPTAGIALPTGALPTPALLRIGDCPVGTRVRYRDPKCDWDGAVRTVYTSSADPTRLWVRTDDGDVRSTNPDFLVEVLS